MRQHLRALVALFALATVPALSATPLELVSGGSTYRIDDLSGQRLTDQGGVGSFTVGSLASGIQNWFWYRGGPDAREYALSNLTFLDVQGDRATLEYSEEVAGFSGPAIKVILQYDLFELAPDRAELTIAYSVQNLTGNNLSLDLFSYSAIDFLGQVGGDSAVLAGLQENVFEVDHLSGSRLVKTVSNRGLRANQMAAAPALRQALCDGGVTNLDGSGSPFGPGDWSGAFQWGTVITPLDTVFVGFVTYDLTAVPEPATLAALGAGLFSLVARRRR